RSAAAKPQQTRAASGAAPTATTPAMPVAVLPQNTIAAFRLVGAAARDAQVDVVPATGQPFAQALRVRTLARPPETFHIQVTAKTAAPVDKDDVLLATFYVRGIESQAETGEARTTIIFEQASEPYAKSLQLYIAER